MEIKEFAGKVQNAVKEMLGDACQVNLQEITKNNHVVLEGLVILEEERNVSPTIYLDPFLDAYEAGIPLGAIVEKILQIYREDVPKNSIDMEFFREFSRVKDRICYRLINREKNEELLKKIPHIEFLDLAICFYYAYKSPELGDGVILIHNTHMEMWKTSTVQMLSLAQENTPRIFPWECSTMGEVIEEMLEGWEQGSCEEEERAEFQKACGRETPMKILSNKIHIHGAAGILYPGLLKRLAQELGGNFYILPSSIHEVILLPDSGGEDTEGLQKMIVDINRTQVEPEEVLSDHLYYYDSVENNVKIC